MKVVFGIGNPGPEYENTRHNLGFRVLDRCFVAWNAQPSRLPGLQATAARGEAGGEAVLLVKPLTYVNLCGPVLAEIRAREALDLQDLLVAVDDMDLPVGRLRLRAQGSDGGHNGLRSLIEALQGEGFARLRIGIGAPGALPAERYVLQPFPAAESEVIDDAVDRAQEAVGLWLSHGVERAMGEVNRPELDQAENGT